MMPDVFPKFIIESGNLIIGKCTYHHQLASKWENVKGGGWFRWEDKTLVLYGSSSDFGTARAEDIQECILSNRVFTDKYCTRDLADTHPIKYDTGRELITFKQPSNGR